MTTEMRETELVYMFPDKATIVGKLLKGFSDDSDFLRVYKLFADRVAKSEKVAHGVNLAFQFAIYDVAQLEGSVPMLSALLNSAFDDLMTALIDDNPDFLLEVINVHGQVVREVAARNTKATQ